MSGCVVAYHGLGGSARLLRIHSQLDLALQGSDWELVFAKSAWRFWNFFGASEAWPVHSTVAKFEQMCEGFLPKVALGFSAGANMAMRIGIERVLARLPIDGLVVYAGQYSAAEKMPETPVELRPPALFLGSPDDPLVPPKENGGEVLAKWWGPKGKFVMLPPGGHNWLPEANLHILDFLGTLLPNANPGRLLPNDFA